MGMGTAGAHAFVISLDELRKICPKEVHAVEDELTWGDVAMEINDNTPPLVEALVEAFNKATDLKLSIEHYDDETGDRYDEVDNTNGCVFCVDGMMQYTPAGEKYKDVIKEQNWTVFG